MKWILQMAWRDTRTSRRRLLLYTASITLGIAALVSIASFAVNMRAAVRDQSVELLGADLVAESRDGFNSDAEAFFATLGGERSDEIAFSSMILFPRTGASRLVSVRAMTGGFPFYGELQTSPAGAARAFREEKSVLVEESLLLQLGVELGDELRLGTESFVVAGALQRVPGESPGFNLIAPRVYLHRRYLESTGLMQRGSRVNHRAYFKLPAEVDADAIREKNRDELREMDVRIESVGSREASLGRTVENLERFLGLIGFVALILGGVGVASGIHVFIKQKLGSIAVLRCVGATTRQTFMIYLVQATALGVVGGVAGALLGAGIQSAIPLVLGDVMPVEATLRVSWTTVGYGILAGTGVTLVLGMLPLLTVRRVSPLLALRSAVESHRPNWRDPAVILVTVVAYAALTLFAVHQSSRWQQGVGLIVGTTIVFGILAAVGFVSMWAARRFLPAAAPYVWRQGVANLFRPNNRTLLVVLALGLGTCLVLAMHLTQGMLLGEVEISQRENRSNMVLFDIQTDQREAVESLMEDHDLPVLEVAPVVSMRLVSVKGVPVADLLKDEDSKTPRWILRRQYRSTYRSSLNDAETLIAGTFSGATTADAEVVPVSVEEGIVEGLGIEVGDRLTFDVQGVPMECEVGSVRAIDTRRMQPFFFVVFPTGVLEDAPQFIVMTTHVGDSETSARLQRSMFMAFPNISAIDLTLIIQTVEGVLDRVGFVLRFMAAFILGTGFVVLAGVMASGRFQRLQESVLLRTIGASRAQIAQIQFVEYLVLGTISSFVGVALAWIGAWALGRWVFHLHVWPELWPLVPAWFAVSALTVTVGWSSGRRMLNQPPLELLRREA